MKDANNNIRIASKPAIDRLSNWSSRKPVIAIMGEFSAGKSSLLNLLIGTNILPTQITATRLPPVWLRRGTEPSFRVDASGGKHPVDLNDPDTIQMNDTRFIRIHIEAEVLNNCDLIDTPGISDPNIPMAFWINTIRYANSVIWCTNSSQAWRESERGAWADLPQRLRKKSVLLVTRKDKIRSEQDFKKIERRLERETKDLFNSRVFASLTQANHAREAADSALWAESGAEEFIKLFNQLIEETHCERRNLLARYAPPSREVEAAANANANSSENEIELVMQTGTAFSTEPSNSNEPTVPFPNDADATEFADIVGRPVEYRTRSSFVDASTDEPFPAAPVSQTVASVHKKSGQNQQDQPGAHAPDHGSEKANELSETKSAAAVGVIERQPNKSSQIGEVESGISKHCEPKAKSAERPKGAANQISAFGNGREDSALLRPEAGAESSAPEMLANIPQSEQTTGSSDSPQMGTLLGNPKATGEDPEILQELQFVRAFRAMLRVDVAPRLVATLDELIVSLERLSSSAIEPKRGDQDGDPCQFGDANASDSASAKAALHLTASMSQDSSRG